MKYPWLSIFIVSSAIFILISLLIDIGCKYCC
jgi:hypothetical protein